MNAQAAMKMESSAIKLNRANLQKLAPSVKKPSYDPAKITAGILHFGVGGFHRAHEALYTDDLFSMNGDNNAWGICGAGVMEADKKMRNALSSQDYLYTLVEKDSGKNSARVIGSLVDYVLATEGAEKVLSKVADPAIKIISLTITEKGYCLDAKGNLDANHPLIKADLASPQKPSSALGYICAGLKLRMEKGIAPVTIMSCDNLPENGKVTKKAILALAELMDPKLRSWIEANITFPNTMVDRITPVTQPQDIAMVEGEFGVADSWPVVCETFRQWVIEDKFCNGRPQWEKAGAQFVSDVHAYEIMKIRLLNGTHSNLAYPGCLIGLNYVDEATTHPAINKFIRKIMDVEVTPTIPPVPGIDLTQYKESVLARFSSTAIKDGLPRIAMDGSQKLQNGVLAAVRERLAKNQSVDGLALAIALWIRYLQGKDEAGKPYQIVDPLAEKLNQLALKDINDPTGIFGVASVFGEDLPKSQAFTGAVANALRSLNKDGTLATLNNYITKA